MYTRAMVRAGSTITRSPPFVVLTNNFVLRYCSATRGEIFALNKPVPADHRQEPAQEYDGKDPPNPVTIRPITNGAIALSFSITPGTAETIRITWPTKAMTTATQMVLNRPQCASAM